jgi:hypothetical protein
MWRRLKLLLWLRLGLLRRGHACLAALVLAAAAAPPMPLLLPLANRRGRPQFNLGLRCFCCHA